MKELLYNLLKEGKSTEEVVSLVYEELNNATAQLKLEKEKEEKAKIRMNEVTAARENVKTALRDYILTLGVCEEEILTTALDELNTMLLTFEEALQEMASAPKANPFKVKLSSTMSDEELIEQFRRLDDYLSKK